MSCGQRSWIPREDLFVNLCRPEDVLSLENELEMSLRNELDMSLGVLDLDYWRQREYYSAK
jgi:hypothetical protein